MRKNLSLASFMLGAILTINTTQAQDRFAFAVTDLNQNSAGWSVLRKLNLQNGEFSEVLLNGVDNKQAAYNASTKKLIEAVNDPQFGNTLQLPFSTGVAAIAFDKKNNRLYYTPMFIDQLRYIDLKTMKVFYVTGQSFTSLGNMHNDEGKIVTRMVIAPDGYGYAITNDANSFIRFSTGKKLQIEQLGALVDDPSNSGISVHNRCSSWGGDMVADDAGKLYVFSAHNNVFKIDPATKTATWLGPVKGLPQGFTINGTVVNDEGKLLAGSQGYKQSWFVIDPKTWEAAEYNPAKGIYLTSDLANSNILVTRKKNTTTEIATIAIRETPAANNIQLFPNPVNNNQFKIQFATAGDFIIELSDVAGKQVMKQKVKVGGEGQLQTISLNKNTAKGIYLVKVADNNNKSVFTQKLVIQ